MGPLLFLVILVPFTINGLAVREAFFVSFLTQLGVDKEAALACGFLFFVVTIALALPGAVILGVENLRGLSGRPGSWRWGFGQDGVAATLTKTAARAKPARPLEPAPPRRRLAW